MEHTRGTSYMRGFIPYAFAAFLVGLVGGLNRLGFSQFAFSDFSLLSYGPTCLILVGTLYLFGRFL